MRTANPQKSNRWVLLRHVGAPDDGKGIHFDLLIEDKKFCRTWRLRDMPVLNGPHVDSVYSFPHHLDWLEIHEKFVSGNRGIATRIKQGIKSGSLPIIEKKHIKLSLLWEDLECDLVINQNGCRIFSKNC